MTVGFFKVDEVVSLMQIWSIPLIPKHPYSRLSSTTNQFCRLPFLFPQTVVCRTVWVTEMCWALSQFRTSLKKNSSINITLGYLENNQDNPDALVVQLWCMLELFSVNCIAFQLCLFCLWSSLNGWWAYQYFYLCSRHVTHMHALYSLARSHTIMQNNLRWKGSLSAAPK